MNNQQVLFFVVSLLPLIGMQNPSLSVVTFVLQSDLQEFLCLCCSNRSQIYLIQRNSDPGLSVVFIQRPNSNFNSVFTIQATGRNFQHGSNFCVSLDPSLWL